MAANPRNPIPAVGSKSFNFVFYIVGECLLSAVDTSLARIRPLNQSETNIEIRKVLYIFKFLPKIAFTLELLLCDCQKYLEWFEVLGEN